MIFIKEGNKQRYFRYLKIILVFEFTSNKVRFNMSVIFIVVIFEFFKISMRIYAFYGYPSKNICSMLFDPTRKREKLHVILEAMHFPFIYPAYKLLDLKRNGQSAKDVVAWVRTITKNNVKDYSV